MNSSLLKYSALISLGVLTSSIVACKEDSPSRNVSQVEIKFKKEGELKLIKVANDSLVASLDIEIADDDYQTQTGLMYRKSMAANHGMLFIFPDTDYRSFYMKNTEIPLDIIYISQDRTIVSIQKNAKPMDETSLPSEGPAKYVLEVNAGLSDEWQLNKGDKIEFTVMK